MFRPLLIGDRRADVYRVERRYRAGMSSILHAEMLVLRADMVGERCSSVRRAKVGSVVGMEDANWQTQMEQFVLANGSRTPATS